ncbi:MAG TPA: hypothetical protein VK858_07885 [Longimicrobiales bacterium]|nr:hypothetical protein [Longimicrobiales bacterium]
MAPSTGAALQQSGTTRAASDTVESGPTILVDAAMAPPAWVAAQRTLLESSAEIAEAYAASNFDAAGHAIRTSPPAWGTGDGPDDIINRAKDWPLAYILGGPESLVETYRRIWEGHLEQYTDGKVPEVEAARDGIFRNDFITQFDWEHSSEELASFYMYSLARPDDPTNNVRARRMAGLYLNEDPAAQNYDPETKVIRSLFNGSLGPRLTPVTPTDWEGLNPSLRFWSVAATDVSGDHPLNMAAAMLPFTAYLLTQDEKYRDWVLEYIGAWRDRTEENGGNIPSNIGLDGTIGGGWGGKWYCGVWGWTGEGERNYVFRGPPEGFDVALLLSGDPSYTQAMRHQIDNLFAAQKVVDGKVLVPHLYDDRGWGGYAEMSEGTRYVQRGNGSGTQGNLVNVLVDLYMTSLRPDDLERIPILPDDRSPQRPGTDTPPGTTWINYIKGNDPGYPMRALEAALAELRAKAVPSGGDGPTAARAPARSSGGWLGVDDQAYPSSISMASLDELPPMREGLGGCVPENGRRLTATSPAAVSVAAAATGAGPRGPASPAPTGGGGGGTDDVGGNGSIPIAALVQLTMGGPNPGGESHGPLPLNVQVRHFDPQNRRPGLPEDVGALVEHFDASSVTLTLVNANPLRERTVTVQMGAYGEHAATEVRVGDRTIAVDGPWFDVRLLPGSGATLTIGVRRYANMPTAAFPWDRAAR